jgi:hypothetical protein
MSFECTVESRRWIPAAACPRGHGGEPDRQVVMPAPAGIQEPYRQLAIALKWIIEPGEDGETFAADPDIDFGNNLRRGEKPYATADDRLYLAGT